jgi:thiamine biosynthesis lipoprotein
MLGLGAVGAATALIVWGPGDRQLDAKSPPASPPSIPETTFGGDTMGGAWSVKLSAIPKGTTAEALHKQIAAVLDGLEGQMSTYRPQSAVSKFNAYRKSDWFDVPPDVVRAVAAAQAVSKESGGAFDVTVGGLVNLWGFGPSQTGRRDVTARVPSDAEIDAARAHVGYLHLHVRTDPPALKKDDPFTEIDLSGIAKGYAAHAVATALEGCGAQNYLIAVGGELRAKGLSPLGRPWRVGIEVPTPDTRRIIRQVELKDCAVSTSGDYRQFFEVNGRRYCHEIDPSNGRPINHGLASASVIHADSTYADGMATAIMVMGAERGDAMAKRLDLGVLLIERGKERFETRSTAAFDKASVASTPPSAEDRLVIAVGEE